MEQVADKWIQSRDYRHGVTRHPLGLDLGQGVPPEAQSYDPGICDSFGRAGTTCRWSQTNSRGVHRGSKVIAPVSGALERVLFTKLWD